jgi:hypothetical protein
MVAKHLAANPDTPAAKLEKLCGEFWTRWTELKAAIDAGPTSLDQASGKDLNADTLASVKRGVRAPQHWEDS